MAKHGKKYLEALSKVNVEESYDPVTAVALSQRNLVCKVQCYHRSSHAHGVGSTPG